MHNEWSIEIALISSFHSSLYIRRRSTCYSFGTLSHCLSPLSRWHAVDELSAMVYGKQRPWSFICSRWIRVGDKTFETESSANDEHEKHPPRWYCHFQILQQLAVGKTLGWSSNGTVWSRCRSRLATIRACDWFGYRLRVWRQTNGMYFAGKATRQCECTAWILQVSSKTLWLVDITLDATIHTVWTTRSI